MTRTVGETGIGGRSEWASPRRSRGGGIGRLPGIALLLWALLLPCSLAAQGSPGAAPGGSEQPVEMAPVTIDGRVLFRVRGISAYPAAQRAGVVRGRILSIARDPGIPPESIRIEERDDRTNVLAGDRFLVGVVDADLEAEGILLPRKMLAELYAGQIGNAIRRYRQEREPQVLLRSALSSLGAMALLALFLLALRSGVRRIDVSIEKRFRDRVRGVQTRTFSLIRSEQILSATCRAVHTLAWIVGLSAAYLASHFALGRFPWTRPFADRMFSLLLDPLETIGKGLVASLPDLAFLLVLFFVTRFAVRLIRLFFTGVAEGRIAVSRFEPEWAIPTFKIVRLFVIAFVAVIAYPYIPGSESSAFKGISIFLGVIVSIGSSSVLANVIAGYSLTYRRAFRLGDRVRIGEYVGDVVEMRNQVTHLRTIKNEEVVVPNSVILGSAVVNYSSQARERGLILHTTVGIGYETPWRQVDAMLRIAAERTPGLLREPPPFSLQTSLGDFCITYELNVHTDRPAEMAVLYSALHRNILDVFNEYGVQIMTPAYRTDTPQPKVVPRDQWYAEPARPPDPPGES